MGMKARAVRLFHYRVSHFVPEDGTTVDYGPSSAGTANCSHGASAGDGPFRRAGWGFGAGPPPRRGIPPAPAGRRQKDDGLISGSPQPRSARTVGKYLHNNGWVVKD